MREALKGFSSAHGVRSARVLSLMALLSLPWIESSAFLSMAPRPRDSKPGEWINRDKTERKKEENKRQGLVG